MAGLDGAQPQQQFQPQGQPTQHICSCGYIFTDDSQYCQLCSARRCAPQGPHGLCSGCGNAFSDSSTFCQRCGARRSLDRGGGVQGLQGVAEEGDYLATRVPESPSLGLALFLFYGGRWLSVYVGLEFVLLLAKGFWLFPYPPGWQATEVTFLVACSLVLRLQQPWGARGNLAQCAPSMAGFLAVGAPAVLLVGYFTCLQVYILNLEHYAGIISLILLSGQLLLAMAAGLSFHTSKQDLAILALGASASVAAFFLIIVSASVGSLGLGGFHALFSLSVIMIAGGLGVAGVAGILALRART